jgi:uncharacterized protein YbgA (DUF1722 family)/uncharacterized protein YbbK (DUF523 family)
MKTFARPRIVVSRCIEFESVRYDGSMMKSELVATLKPFANFIPVCPEVEIGLPIPRDSLRIINNKDERRLVQTATGLDLTDKMNKWADNFLHSLPPIDGFIMKAKSPSSALFDAKVYPSLEKVASIGRGAGFFGAKVLAGFSHLAVEDEMRLLNTRIRDHFLKKLFTLASFRELKEAGSTERLVQFQAENKLLLTAYSQKELGTLGRLVANRKNIPQDRLFNEYFEHLVAAFKQPPRSSSNINIALKSFGYFSDRLEHAEKQFFMEQLDNYRAGKVPFSVPAAILNSWFVRFKEEYLLNQTFYNPYPNQLANLETTSARLNG